MSIFRSRWKQLATLLGAALETERDRIPVDQADFIAEFIDYNEFGLAFDQLEYALDDAGLAPTEVAAAAMDQAADLMGISRSGELGRASR